MTHSTLNEKVTDVLKEIQPMLGMHGGSIELVTITTDNVVHLRFKGACVGCMAADYTLEYGLKELLMVKIEEIEDVIAVNDEPLTHLPPKPIPYAQH
jgi:Fe-S cluster biogenesis protein NfuA